MDRLSNRSIRFLHLADLHFGTENHGRIDPETGIHSRLLDFSNTLEKVLDQAFEQEIDAVLFAGDAYRTGRPSPTQERELARHIERISRSGIPLVMIIGNHDLPSASGQANSIDVFRTLNLPGVQVIDKPERLEVQTRKGILQVLCIPYPTRQKIFALPEIDVHNIKEEQVRGMIEEALTRYIHDQVKVKNPEQPLVILAHIAVSKASLSGTERTMHLAEEVNLLPGVLTQAGIDYCALGHIHRFQDLNKSSQPPVVYPGTLERIDFSEENDPKGFVLVDVEPGQAQYQFFPLKSRAFVTIQVDLTEQDDPTLALKKIIEEARIEEAVVRIECTATDEQKQELDFKQIEPDLQAADYVSSFNVRPPEIDNPVRRSNLNESMAVQEALKTYFDQQNMAPTLQEKLLKRAQQLEEQYKTESNT